VTGVLTRNWTLLGAAMIDTGSLPAGARLLG
jgi:hypothetical protein